MKLILLYLLTIGLTTVCAITPENQVTLKNFLWTILPVEYYEQDPRNNKNGVTGVGRLYVNFENGIIEIIGLRESAPDKNKLNFFSYKIQIVNSIKRDSSRYSFTGESDKFHRRASGSVEFEMINPDLSYYRIKRFELNHDQTFKITNILSKKAKDIMLKYNDVNFVDDGTINNGGEIMKNVINPTE